MLFRYSTLTPQWKWQGKYVWHAFMAKYNPFGLKGYFWRTIWTHSTCYEWCTCDKIWPSTTHLVWKGTCVRSPWAMTKHWDPTGLSSDLYHKDIYGYHDGYWLGFGDLFFTKKVENLFKYCQIFAEELFFFSLKWSSNNGKARSQYRESNKYQNKDAWQEALR